MLTGIYPSKNATKKPACGCDKSISAKVLKN
jgi:hypothetical protein